MKRGEGGLAQRTITGMIWTAWGKAARVVEAIYLGQMVRYHLAPEGGGTPIVAAVPFVGKPYATGETVAVSWDVADIWPVA